MANPHEPQLRSETALKATSSVQNIGHGHKPPFGSRRAPPQFSDASRNRRHRTSDRFLADEADVWQQNAWDHVPPPVGQQEVIAASLARHRSVPVPDHERSKYNQKPYIHWYHNLALFFGALGLSWTARNDFYKKNSKNFFRDRKWLRLEFPELLAATEPEAGPMTIAELGCGAGNAVFPILSANQNPSLRLRAYDYSKAAVKLVQENPLYESPPTGSIQAAVWDITSDDLPSGLVPDTVDIVILVFVMSALHPDEWGRALANIHKVLKPGGLALFRDYGRYDLTQLRFKTGRLLDDNFYIRGDKTRVYFFELDELALLFTGSPLLTTSDEKQASPEPEDDPSGAEPPSADITANTHHLNITIPSLESNEPLRPTIHPNLTAPLLGCPPHPLFSIEQLGIDRRLLVNRKRQLKMYRVWVQGKFRKLQN